MAFFTSQHLVPVEEVVALAEEEVVEVEEEAVVTVVALVAAVEVEVTVEDVAEVEAEAHQEAEVAEEVVAAAVEWEVARKFSLNLIVTKVFSLPEERKMLLSPRTWP